MKKSLLVLIILISSLGLTACGEVKSDTDIDKMVSLSCDMFWEKEGSMEESKIEEIKKLGEKIEAKYKWKEKEFIKIRKASFQKQCPDIYKKMIEKKVMKE